ncbi:MAG TPA: hypothetical protein VFY40_18925 [Blastocatellia bacterium]|nr:hypothetical protein [Blastocatellia bacterium]
MPLSYLFVRLFTLLFLPASLFGHLLDAQIALPSNNVKRLQPGGDLAICISLGVIGMNLEGADRLVHLRGLGSPIVNCSFGFAFDRFEFAAQSSQARIAHLHDP